MINQTTIMLGSILLSTANISYAASCPQGIYVQGDQHCAENKTACPSKYLYHLSCENSEVKLELLRPSSTAKKYGYRAGDIRYQGSTTKGSFVQYFPTKKCGKPVRVNTAATVKITTLSIEIDYQRHQYNESRCTVKSNSTKSKKITLLKVKS